MNLRPPGYEPGELPDCSTPRGQSIRAAINRSIRSAAVISNADLKSAGIASSLPYEPSRTLSGRISDKVIAERFTDAAVVGNAKEDGSVRGFCPDATNRFVLRPYSCERSENTGHFRDFLFRTAHSDRQINAIGSGANPGWTSRRRLSDLRHHASRSVRFVTVTSIGSCTCERCSQAAGYPHGRI